MRTLLLLTVLGQYVALRFFEDFFELRVSSAGRHFVEWQRICFRYQMTDMTEIFNSCLGRIFELKVCVASWRRNIAKFLRVKLLSFLFHIVGIALTRIYSTAKL